MREKVFVIGYELVSPIAVGIKNIIPNLQKNYSADGPLIHTDTSGMPFKTGAEIREDLSPLISREDSQIQSLCKTDRKMELLVACFQLLQQQNDLSFNHIFNNRIGVILGIGAESTPYELFQEEIKHFLHEKTNAMNELMSHSIHQGKKIQLLNNPYDIFSHYLGDNMNAGTFRKSILTACVSSTQAMAHAFDSISRNQTDLCISGGTDSILNLTAMMSFGKLGVISETNSKINCRPFDINRNGTIAGEAAGIILLASEKFVTENKIQPIAQLTGYGNTLDAYKITSPDPSATSMSRAIEQALNKSDLKPQDIDYIQAHGTGTQHNDDVELKAIELALKEYSAKIPISGTKDRHGHAIAAAGIQEVCILLECMKNNFIPGNLNMRHPLRPEMNLVKTNMNLKIKNALTNNFAFGGINTVLAFKNELT